MKRYLTNALLALTITLCTASCAENILMSEEIPSLAARVTVTAPNILTDTRAAYSGYSLSFESGDKIGVYVLGRNILESNVCFTYNGTAWVPDQEIEYSDDYTYYAYYPYVAAAYAPDFSQAEIDDMFAEYINDEGNKFHRADQSVKAAFNASDLMIGQGECDGNGTVAFTLGHKKGLAVFTGSYADGIFSGDNIPYTVDTKGYYLMKADVPYTFTDATDDTYLLYASCGKYITHEIPKQYLTFIALEDGTFSFTKSGLSYSLDDGETWTALSAGANTTTVTAGSKILWKNNTTMTPVSYEGIGTFSSTGTFEIEGNIMSLHYGDNAVRIKTLDTKRSAFELLFHNTKVVNAKKLKLPATTLSYYCYRDMFSGCTGLISAPSLPATKLTNNCYSNMFEGCTALATAPELPATTVSQGCYSAMFRGCTSLVTAPELSVTKMISQCYEQMFQNCTALTTAPTLPATTLGYRCYAGMFVGCTALTTAPELPATTLASNCYANMFAGCTALTTAPELPATTMEPSCYQYMFSGCTALTTAPTLPATTLATYCYDRMFQNCTELVTAPSLPATELYSNCYNSMFSGCTALTTAPTLPATTLADYCYRDMFYRCTALITAPTILPATSLAGNCYYEMFSGCSSLTTAPELPATTLVTSCYNKMFYGCTNLNYIKAAFTTTPGSYTSDWVYGISSTGTFYKNSAASWNVTGTNGVPSGWTVVTYTP